MIDAYVIRVKDDNTAVHAAMKIEQTAPSNVNVIMFDAVKPKDVAKKIRYHGLRWNYPWESEELDIQSGLIKKAYPTLVKEKRIACFFSHYILWKRCVKNDTPIVIHEHDAIYYAGG
jgi:GR25 family glycosyltransferase involved in LPS biosynthesis